MSLNKKQLAFVDEYFRCGFNGTQAYLAVYRGATEKTAVTNASRLLTNANVKSEIDKRHQELTAKSKIDREYLLKEYLELLESCKKEGVDGVGTIKDRTNWARALAQVSKLLGLDAPEKIEHSGTINLRAVVPGIESEDQKLLDDYDESDEAN